MKKSYMRSLLKKVDDPVKLLENVIKMQTVKSVHDCT